MNKQALFKRIRWVIIVIVILLILGIIPTWKNLLVPFADQCGYESEFAPNTTGFVKECSCDGFSFGSSAIGSYNTYCVGTCGVCECRIYNNSFTPEVIDCAEFDSP